MAKKIKKKIKKSIPLFLVFSLIISSTVVGLVFNFNIDILRTNNFDISALQPIVKADDVATTTVEVQNAPPSITTDPAEVPSSTSTSPVNLGDTLSFTVTAHDGENNDYQLIICSSDSIVADASGGDSHHCGDVTYATSSFVASDAQATAYYTVADPADNPGAEVDEWYAFVCDNHATQADCTETGSQGAAPGSGDDSSPYYINHAPIFSSVSTTDDNKDPGQTYTITASTTDSDTLGGNDIIHLYVCETDSWATSTGCTGVEYCHATSSSPNVSCNYATGTIAMDGDWDYYAFVMDWHGMAASGNSQTSTYTVNNVAPSVSNVVINGTQDIEVNLRGVAEVVASSSSVSVTDNNGCSDIQGATSTIYWSSVTGDFGCSPDDNNCYQIGSTHCSVVAGTCGDTSPDATASYICTTTIAYHAIPTDGSGGNYPYTGTNWLAALTAYDEALYDTATSVTGVDLVTVTGLDITEDEVPYGTVKGGDNTGASNATTTVINLGNSPLDSGIDVNDMDKDDATPNLIEAENQYFSTSTFTYGSGNTFYVHEASSTLQFDIEAARPTSASAVSDQIFWGIGIPAGKPSGTYTGLNTFSAILDNDAW